MKPGTTESNRNRARKRLEQYQQASRDLQYLSDQIDILEEKVMRSTRPIDLHAGWTGQYWGRSKYGKGWIYSLNPEELTNPRPAVAMTKSDPGTNDPKGGEKLLVALIDQQICYEQKALAALNLCLAIEAEIDAACVGIRATALKYRYLHELTFGQIAEKMNYSITQIRRLIDEAFDQYSEKMAHLAEI